MSKLLPLAALLLVFCSESSNVRDESATVEASGPVPNYQTIVKAINQGGSCPDLFRLRNKLNPHDPQIERVNHDLRAIGCYSSSSTRFASPSTAAAETTASSDPEHSFTVREYRIYSSVITAPMSIPEAEAVRATAQKHDITPAQVKQIVSKVMGILTGNKWFGSPETEIRHASDWGR